MSNIFQFMMLPSPEIKQRIIEQLNKHPSGLTISQTARLTGVTFVTAKKHLTRLCEDKTADLVFDFNNFKLYRAV